MLTGNFISGAYNKDGGSGYYQINGDNNFIYNEHVEHLRHRMFGSVCCAPYQALVL